jgi:uncharacterized membrane protein YfcA
MLLIAEFILTIFAWRNGWRWYSLIPIGVAVVIGIIIGISVGASGGSVDDVNGVALIFDIGAVIALIVLCAKKPKSAIESTTNVTTEEPKKD